MLLDVYRIFTLDGREDPVAVVVTLLKTYGFSNQRRGVLVQRGIYSGHSKSVRRSLQTTAFKFLLPVPIFPALAAARRSPSSPPVCVECFWDAGILVWNSL